MKAERSNCTKLWLCHTAGLSYSYTGYAISAALLNLKHSPSDLL